jgi:hypothetical protein
MKSLLIRKVGSGAKKALTLGAEGLWTVTDGETAVATAQSHTLTTGST